MASFVPRGKVTGAARLDSTGRVRKLRVDERDYIHDYRSGAGIRIDDPGDPLL